MDAIEDRNLPNNWRSQVLQIDKNLEQTKSEFKKLENKNVLVACSGGADSVALAVLARSFDLEFGLAYIDHGINLATSECEIIVKNLAQICDVPFYVKHLDMSQNNIASSNVEATARSLRYSALEEIRANHGYNLIVTAHHLDDVAETYLINLIRGAGSGISSLASKRQDIARPILHWRKSDLEELVTNFGLDFFTDEMNLDPRYVRNRIRNEVIPLLNEISKRDVSPLIARAAKFAQKDNQFLSAFASSQWPKKEPSTKALMALDPVIAVHALRAWIDGYPPSEEEMDRILEVVHHKRTRVQISGNRTIWRSGAILYQDVTSTQNN